MSNFFSKLFGKREDVTSAFFWANKVLELQKENRELRTLIMELEQRVDARIDKIQPVIYNIHNKQNAT
tara:strand:- start:429 stop:632 length:204 start_codon:yes stop_codon:yes gene_type:complete